MHTQVMAFEPLGSSLLQLIKDTDYRGLPLSVVATIARCVLKGLDHLHSAPRVLRSHRTSPPRHRRRLLRYGRGPGGGRAAHLAGGSAAGGST